MRVPFRYYQRFQLSPLFFGGHGRSNFYQMIVDTFWASISMAVVIGMRGGQLAPEVCHSMSITATRATAVSAQTCA